MNIYKIYISIGNIIIKQFLSSSNSLLNNQDANSFTNIIFCELLYVVYIQRPKAMEF